MLGGRGRERGGERKRKTERAAASDLALGPNATTVRFDDSLGDGQPEAAAHSRPLIALPVSIEHMHQICRGDPRSGVGDAEAGFAAAKADANAHVSAGGRELDGV